MLAVAAVAATFLLFPFLGLISWSSAPLVVFLIAVPVLTSGTLR